MDFDFTPIDNALTIPKEVYRPIKRCPYCFSVYLTDVNCETCGKSINFDLLGRPFSHKSFYGIKEKYILNLPFYVSYFPILEDRKDRKCESYLRNQVKRLNDILKSFSQPHSISIENRKIFYMEMKDIIVELLSYEYRSDFILSMIQEYESEQILFQEIILFTQEKSLEVVPSMSLWQTFLSVRLFNILRVEFVLKLLIGMATIIFVAIKFRTFFYH